MTRDARVVVIGGGHGARVTVQASMLHGFETAAVLSVADDGGSSGALGAAYDIPAVGDLRTTFAASLGKGSLPGELLEYRFKDGPLHGHPVGNVMLAALTELTGTFSGATEVLRGLFPGGAKVLPATDARVTLCARDRAGQVVRGQLAVSRSRDLDHCWVEPHPARCTLSVRNVIEEADYILLGPGSLYTSVIAALVTGGIAEIVGGCRAKVVYVHNLAAQVGESEGLTLSDHVEALSRHGVAPDIALVDSQFASLCKDVSIDCRIEPLAGSDSRHDVRLLGTAIAKLVDESGFSTL